MIVSAISGLSVAPPKRNLLSLGVPEKIGDGFHGQKGPVGPVRQRKKVEVLVKADSFLVNGINDDSKGGDLRRLHESAAQRVDEEKFTESLPLLASINSQSAQKCGGNNRIGRELPDYVGGQVCEIDSERGQRVITENGLRGGFGDNNKRRRDSAASILAGQLF